MRNLAASLVVLLLLAPLARAQQATPNAVAAAQVRALMTDAMKAFSGHDYQKTATLLDQVREIDPKQPNLNAVSGFAAYQLGRYEEAIRYFQQQQAITPEAVKLYAPQALCQIALNRPSDALATVQTWVSKAPDSPDAAMQLVALYLDFQNGPEALAAANKALQTLPEQDRDNPTFRRALGRAQIMAGNTDAGVATLTALLKDEDDPAAINDIAYELAKTGRQLPLAESAERAALEDLASDSRDWTLEHDKPAAMRQASATIVAAWDTLGLILFQEKKYREAKDFVTASWINSPHPEVGEHLGDIEARLGNDKDALHAYELALTAVPVETTSTETALDKPQVDSLQEKIDVLKKAGVESTLTGPANLAFKQLHTVSLGPAGDRQGEARYLVLLDRTHVINVQPAGDASISGAEKAILKANVGLLFPAASDTRLAKFARLNCNAATCELTFEP